MTRLKKEAEKLSRLTGFEVLPDLYCLGYWAHYAKLPRPRSGLRRKGWDDARDEQLCELDAQRIKEELTIHDLPGASYGT